MTTIRKEAGTLSVAEQNTYINAIKHMLATPSNPYGKLVSIHGNMMHNMHGMNAVGTQRFLSWHRAYLLHFEKKLHAIDSNAFIPYWDWTKHKAVPAWMNAFTPTVKIPGTGAVIVKRNTSIPAIINISSIMALTNYTDFTDQLENGPHGEVHMEVGVVNGHAEAMAKIMVSPSDPIFWMHHAQIDRIWSQWQTNHPSENPTLAGSDAVMDPWSETATQLKSIAALHYSYA
ncbi:MAG: tyrosinase family protein [Planctomycetes bacterium]|nr:tyrosinase family protein [Planctomycetota bacterium]